jgi:hypothetical protein
VVAAEPRSELYFSPYPGGRPDWPRCAFCDRAPVVLSARREGGFGSALFCADCAPRVREGDPQVTARVPER